MKAEEWFVQGRQLHERQQLAEAEKCYLEALKVDANYADAWHLAGVAAGQRGDVEEAIRRIRRAISLYPRAAIFYNNLGVMLRQARRFSEAAEAFATAVVWMPASGEYQCNLGTALQELGGWTEAEAAYRRAVELDPSSAFGWNNLGNALCQRGETRQGLEAYQKAIKLRSDYAEAYYNMGQTLRDLRRFEEAEEAYRTAVRLAPQMGRAYNNLGQTMRELGEAAEAVENYRRALNLEPGNNAFHSNLILEIQYLPGVGEAEVAGELKRFDERICGGRTRGDGTFGNARDAEKRLRVGYVSSDFFSHACGHFLVPLLRAHDHERFEIFCYADQRELDAVTRQLMGYADQWRNIYEMKPEAAADLIRRDGIDVLVDLKLHTGWNQLAIFAKKPCPVQVSWLGYPGTSGLRTIDWRVTDRFLEPEGKADGGERALRLGGCFWCYDPLAEAEVAVGALPAKRNGFVTFGCLNSPAKVNEATVALWRAVLERMPNSRMVVRVNSGKMRDRILAGLGVAGERVIFWKSGTRGEYMRMYQGIDICLDTIPYNGHTTTLDALYMGVPTVSVLGEREVGRAGLSILSNVGMPELVGKNAEEFVAIACELAGDVERLAGLRARLREKMRASPLMDEKKFAREMEKALRVAWQAWCKR